ncbi:MAG TPA: outer membrane beta-barrel protein [Edaphocola sp.]|nr:outer membrane beta-barrel protein [Edaphocola sp.]
MIKIYILALTLGLNLLSISATAQSDTRPTKIQLETGVSSSNMRIVYPVRHTTYKFRGTPLTKMNVGAYFNIPWGKTSSWRPGLQYFVGGTNLFQNGFYREYFLLKYIRMHQDVSFKLWQGRRQANVFFDIGPYFGYLVDGVFTYNGGRVVGHKGLSQAFDRIDYGGMMSLGYMFGNGLYLRTTYGHGAHNVLYKKNNPGITSLRHTRNWTFNFGLQF